ncbi:ATP-binding cassette domain-containing protein [Ruminococcaceae bacterium OttesenSCG-928-D13]|nr:ATP-binding cassette domain-containing protein [Ruminococcaceae bacterium OttesenSCG-928-D13]
MKMNAKTKHRLQTVAAALFWVAVWQLASMLVNQVLFLPSPVDVVRALAGMLPSGVFWRAVGTSLWRIALGFLLGLVVGCGLATLAAASGFAEILLRPLMLLVRSTPVASFIILALVWINSRGLSTFISFLMVLPVIYSATLLGIRSADKKLLEMAGLFRVGHFRRLRAIYLPALLPALLNACELALGMSWKSGVAAEVIGLPAGTIGERLYQAKIFLQMPELFAWTAVIIALSAVFGKAVIALMRGGVGLLENTEGFARKLGAQPAASDAAGVDAAPPKPTQPIRVEGVDKAFGGQQVLRGFSATLPAGAATALMGPSGGGKTTLARIIMGLERPDAGRVETAPDLRFDCVFQEDRLCEQLSAAGNVALVLPKTRWGSIALALAAVGLDEALAQKPVRDLSGGERRRVALVRAVLATGQVLVLDEAFKGLDAASREVAFGFVRARLDGRSLLVITHDAAEAEAFGAGVVPVGA